MSAPAFTQQSWGQNGLTVSVHGRGTIAVIPTPQNGGVTECSANARLIAAAPELYETAEAFLRAWCDGQTPESAAHLAIELGRALRKARGEHD